MDDVSIPKREEGRAGMRNDIYSKEGHVKANKCQWNSDPVADNLFGLIDRPRRTIKIRRGSSVGMVI